MNSLSFKLYRLMNRNIQYYVEVNFVCFISNNSHIHSHVSVVNDITKIVKTDKNSTLIDTCKMKLNNSLKSL
jgi:hypothetical protein